MSLEATIAENTAAIRELIEAIRAGAPTTPAQVQAVVEEAAKVEKAEAKKETKSKAEKQPEPQPEPEAEQPADESKAEAAEQPTYNDAAAVITKLSRVKGRDAAVALLAKFEAKKLPDVKPEQFADVIAAAEEAMA